MVSFIFIITFTPYFSCLLFLCPRMYIIPDDELRLRLLQSIFVIDLTLSSLFFLFPFLSYISFDFFPPRIEMYTIDYTPFRLTASRSVISRSFLNCLFFRALITCTHCLSFYPL